MILLSLTVAALSSALVLAPDTAIQQASTRAGTDYDYPLPRVGGIVSLSIDGSTLSPGIAYCVSHLTGPLSGRIWCLDALVTESPEVGLGLSVSMWRAGEQPPTAQLWLGVGSLAPYEQADEPNWSLIIYAALRR